MKLPALSSPEWYSGLYVFDFGHQVAVGYTADEIAVLLESERFADGKVYRIHRALPDGTLELKGVAPATFQREDGFLFYRADSAAAAADFRTLAERADGTPPPCRAKVHLARIAGASYPELTALIFPAEYAHDMAGWLDRIGFDGGDFVEGGPSQVTGYAESGATVLERAQLWPTGNMTRSAEEVLASVDQAVQRVPA